MGSNKPRGLQAARKLRNDRRENRWADKAYKKRALGNIYKTSPTGGSSHAKGIVLEKVGVEAKQPNSAIRKCVRVQLIKNGKKVTAFVPNDGCLNFVDENDEVLISGFGRRGKAKGDIPGVRFKIVKVSGVGLLALWKEKKHAPPPPPRPPAESEDEGIPLSIAARIANLKLGQVGGSPKIPPVRAKPPPIPARRQETTTGQESAAQNVSKAGAAVELRNPRAPPVWIRLSAEDLARALARRPPPPPPQRHPVSDVHTPLKAPPSPPEAKPPQRRIPPVLPPRSDPQPPYKHPELDAVAPDDGKLDFCPECRDFAHVDAHAALFPRHSVTSLDDLAYSLTGPFPFEIEKARAIFTWLHYNVAYDTDSFFSGNVQQSTAESTLSSGLAVCDGYAGLFKSLAERVGIQVHKVTGHGKGVGWLAIKPGQPLPPYSSNHAWNCAFLDGEWHLIDSCWGAGALDGYVYQQGFAPRWFTSSPQEFGRTHFPEDLSYQLMSEDDGGAVTWEDYIMEPEGPTISKDFYKLDLWSTTLQPSTKAIQGGTRIVFYVFKRCEHMSTSELDNYVYMLSVGNERVPLEVNAEGGWGADVYIPRGSGEVSLFYVITVNGQDAKGMGVSSFRKALGRSAMTFGGLAKWDVI
ncbi:hypothetical protein C0993_001688 [Termitomyces sp. T159_Od127]|nr:hypothetical protein C0993_001688 [Termitomyces sp. T159_Od127]